MTFALAGTLAVLALIDSTSFGTLLIPVWLMLAPGRLRPGRVLLFLTTVAAFYLAVGLLLLAGVQAAFGFMTDVLATRAGTVVQLLVGATMLVSSFFMNRKGPDGEPRPSRMLRWRDRALGEGEGAGPLLGLMGLALAAAAVEVASMLPYLGAIGLLTASDLGTAERVGTLALYCVVMVLPAVLLLAARIGARRVVEPVLGRVARWMERASGETTAWVVGILGFFIARAALVRLPELTDLLPALGQQLG